MSCRSARRRPAMRAWIRPRRRVAFDRPTEGSTAESTPAPRVDLTRGAGAIVGRPAASVGRGRLQAVRPELGPVTDPEGARSAAEVDRVEALAPDGLVGVRGDQFHR